jgi:multidrug efflux pump subunit AcrB
MTFYSRLIQNHPLANITFAVVLVIGADGLSHDAARAGSGDQLQLGDDHHGAAGRFGRGRREARDQAAGGRDQGRRRHPLRDVLLAREHRLDSGALRDVDERVFDKRINDLRREIQNKATSELPVEAKEPHVIEITTSNGFPTAMVLVTGQAADELLRSRSRQFKDDIERIAGVDQVFATGLRDPELQVEFDPVALANRGLTATDASDAVMAWFRDTFAGKVETAGEQERTAWLVRVVGQSADPDEIARIPVSNLTRREPVPLGNVAEVSRGRARAGSLASYQGKGAVILAVTKKSRTNTLQLIERLNTYIAEQNPRFTSDGVQLQMLDDQTVPTREAIGTMERNALQGLLLVLAITWLFLGTRVAILIGIGIPFSLAGTFAILNALGYTLNISVLLGVVIVLGMLVDDAVVVVETIYYRMQRGESVHTAAIGAVREVFAPVTASVLTTIAAFLPLMLLPGIVGKFMFVIPFVVTLGLAISLIEAYWMLPAHMAVLAPKAGDGHLNNWRDRFNHFLRVKYSRWLLWVMRRPKRSLIIAVALMLGAVAAVGVGLVRIQFFAFDPIRLFYVNVDMPAGAPIEQTLANAERLEAVVRKHLKPNEARNLASYAGVKFSDTEPLYGESYGQVTVSLNPRKGGREVAEIVEAMRADVEATPTPGKITFTMISGGPPLAKPVKARVRNDDPQELRAAGDALLAIVRAVPGAKDVADDDIPGRPELVLALDRGALRASGLDAGKVARLLRLHADGEIVAMMRDKGEKVELRVRAKHGAGDGKNGKSAGTVGADITGLLDDPIALPAGGTTTLRALVTEETRIGKGVIKHYNLRRAITVEADLDKTVTDTVAANRIIAAEWKKLAVQFPNTDIDFSGEMDDIQESLDAMGVLFLMGVGLIYLILAAQFKSYMQPMLILITVPLAFTGVILGLLVARIPLSLYTLYGVIALTGIAVNSAIVLIDAANERLASGMSVLHAAVYAARRRVVPILITSVTTIGGLFSLAVGLGGKSLLWGPVAASIVWGLGFSTVLTLFVMPLLYWMFMRRFGAQRASAPIPVGAEQ